ncbi:MAG: transporter associated domain-containing protein, partial [Pseudorhodoplanes sp.]
RRHDLDEFIVVDAAGGEFLARIPSEGEAFMMDGWRIEVIDMDGKRVDKLLFIPPEEPDAA